MSSSASADRAWPHPAGQGDDSGRRAEESEATASALPAVDILHADDCLIVAVKFAGLLSVPGRGSARQDCLASRVQALHADARVVHRLDMATSGLMLFARGAEPQRRLNRAFAERAVAKRYVAIVHGRPPVDCGVIDLPLAADWPNRPKQQIDRLGGKPSVTRYRVLASDGIGGDTWSRLVLEPVTGRAHQLRVHLLAIGHPILGDALYAPAPVQAMAGRLMLHAERLALAHPASGEQLVFDAAAPF